MGIVSERFATRLIDFDVMLDSVGGVVGTLHHGYVSGGPAVEMALGAFFLTTRQRARIPPAFVG